MVNLFHHFKMRKDFLMQEFFKWKTGSSNDGLTSNATNNFTSKGSPSFCTRSPRSNGGVRVRITR